MISLPRIADSSTAGHRRSMSKSDLVHHFTKVGDQAQALLQTRQELDVSNQSLAREIRTYVAKNDKLKSRVTGVSYNESQIEKITAKFSKTFSSTSATSSAISYDYMSGSFLSRSISPEQVQSLDPEDTITCEEINNDKESVDALQKKNRELKNRLQMEMEINAYLEGQRPVATAPPAPTPAKENTNLAAL